MENLRDDKSGTQSAWNEVRQRGFPRLSPELHWDSMRRKQEAEDIPVGGIVVRRMWRQETGIMQRTAWGLAEPEWEVMSLVD